MSVVIDKRFKATTEAVKGAGVLCWWEIEGTVDYDAIIDALDAAGLASNDWRPRPPSHEQCLTRAIRDFCGERRRSGVYALRRSNAWWLIDAHVDVTVDDLDIAAFARLRLAEKDGATVLARKVLQPGREELIAQVAAAFRAGVEAATVHETSSWLSRVHQRALGGTRLRDGGGIYFVPQPSREDWATFWGAIAKVGGRHVAYGIDAMPTEETVRAVLDAVARDVDAVLAEVAPAFDAPDALTTRGANAIERKLEGALARLVRYDGILGDRLEDLRDKLGDARGLLGATRLRAMSAENDE